MYCEDDLVRIAKRDNNTKRNYLVVNRFQGKHIPVSPSTCFAMFDALSSVIRTTLKDEKLLLIGFAETATAIGAYCGVTLGSFYMQTTREIIDGEEYLFFQESHSHATEQKLVKGDVEKVINEVDRVVFVEDEVTTGNTIMNIVKIMKKNYGEKIKFGVASILNGMTEEYLDIFKAAEIPLMYLVKTDHSTYIEKAEKFSGNGNYFICNDNICEENCIEMNECSMGEYLNARRLISGNEYRAATEKLACAVIKETEKIPGFSFLREECFGGDSSHNSNEVMSDDLPLNSNDGYSGRKLLVVGTEEFMYPAIRLGLEFEKSFKGLTVRTHSTTRSPIAVSLEEGYPLGSRYQLKSLFDSERKTFIYNIEKYDGVIILTDAADCKNQGLATLIDALKMEGNDNILLVRWM